MAVVAKVGMREEHGKVRTAEGIVEVRRSPDGSYTVPDPAGGAPGRVAFDDDRDILDIAHGDAAFSIRFRGETERTTFELGGHTYDVATMDFGAILIKEGSRPVVQGHVTVSGVRLVSVASDLAAVERELAFGLALRSEAISKDFWREDQPFFERFKESVETDVLEGEERLRGERKEPNE